MLLNDTDEVRVTTDINGSVKVHASYLDSNGTFGRKNTAITVSGTLAVVSSPSSTLKRGIRRMWVRNNSTVRINADVKHFDGSISSQVWKGLLLPNEVAVRTDLGTWDVYTSGGIKKVTSFIGPFDNQTFIGVGGNYNWIRPSWATVIGVRMFGAGGGGGAGSGSGCGGGGGGGGSYLSRIFLASDLPTVVRMQVGRGSHGSVGAVAGSQSNAAVSQATRFGLPFSYMLAGGGGGGGGGDNGGNSAGGGGGGGTGANGFSGTNQASGLGGGPGTALAVNTNSVGAGAGAAGNGWLGTANRNNAEYGGGGGCGGLVNNFAQIVFGGSSMYGAGGGGGGTSTSAGTIGTVGGQSGSYVHGGGGAGGVTGGSTAGTAGATGSATKGGSGGGGGGGGVTGGRGGDGGWPGGGGGGGGSGGAGSNIGGDGGNGADGAIWVSAW